MEKSGFVPFQARVDVLPDANVEVHATLVRESQAKSPWYKRWYVWATVGGVVAAGAIATAIYFGTRVDPTPLGYVQQPPASGTMTTAATMTTAKLPFMP